MAAQTEGLDFGALEDWRGEGEETFSSLLKARMPSAFLTGEAPLTPEASWFMQAVRLVETHETFRERRRFIIHFPQEPPFARTLMFDLGDPVKARPGDGAPIIAVRYASLGPGDPRGPALGEEFYKSQRDGFVNADAAVVAPADSVVGLAAPTLECLNLALATFEANKALLAPAYRATFTRSLMPTFLGPLPAPALPAAEIAAGDYVELAGMKTEAYNGLQGVVVGPAEGHPDRWAVSPQRDADVARARKLRKTPDGQPLVALAIKAENLRPLPRPADAEAEECD